MVEVKHDLSCKICPNCRREFDAGPRICPFDDTLLAPIIADELIGATIDGKLRVLARISAGGWGSVYQAHHMSLDQIVALKVLHREYASDLDRVARFQREAQTISSLRNSHVVLVHDYGMLPSGRPYLVMEYLHGESLAALVASGNTLRLPVVLDIFMQACDALSAAHRKGIVHRDIKPGNIMFYDDGGGGYMTKILDFGLARLMNPERSLTKSGETVGSPSYMSPEQCRGGHIDGRSDIYSLGCVMFEVLTGEKIFEGESTVDCMSKHLFMQPKLFARTKRGRFLPKIVEQVVLKCIAKDPRHRYQNVDDLRSDLGDALLVSVGGDLPAKEENRPSVFKAASRFAEQTRRTCLFLLELARVLGSLGMSH